MTVVTAVSEYDLYIAYFDGNDQLIPFRGFFVEGIAPRVPGDDDNSFVAFELEVADNFFEVCCDLAQMLFCELGFPSDQVIRLLEEF